LSFKLPEPNAEQITISHNLVQHLGSLKQPIRFDDYMQQVLYAPGLGYYAGGSAKFDASGDFITAPLLGNLFAKTLAHQFSQIIQQTGPDSIFLEIGAGTGTFALDMLTALAELDALPKQYWILELSADLAQRQQQLLEESPELKNRVRWISQLPQDKFNGIIFSNEVLDALPVRLFHQRDNAVYERFVEVSDNTLNWVEHKADKNFAESIRQRLNSAQVSASQSYQSESCDILNGWIQSLSDSLNKGYLWLVDYGYVRNDYYHPQRDQGTLICHYRHHAHDDPLHFPGLTDISSFVDFTAVAEAGTNAGLSLAGYASQGEVLMALGIDQHMLVQEELTPEYLNQAHQFKTLILPTGMGEKFKMMAFSQNMDLELEAFTLTGERHRL